ncbi:4F2 cell-surface antigen heavy chain-like [Stegostoma tigrinum]|uniref:4F2 cell-surface antigen heavy chain-like n=1 Tax=Stegostoma tigrinum TaxID=3053191 RepID=UPI00202B7580|nr:4F2 cell-surface antigen heavy chain-like [Stegostoma tigrinum]
MEDENFIDTNAPSEVSKEKSSLDRGNGSSSRSIEDTDENDIEVNIPDSDAGLATRTTEPLRYTATVSKPLAFQTNWRFLNKFKVPDKESRVPISSLFRPLSKLELQMAGGPKWRWIRRCALAAFWLTWTSLLAAALVIILETPECKPSPSLRWWQRKPMYRIALQSYYDTNGDGVGDLLGIQRKVEYIKKLHVGSIVITPLNGNKFNSTGLPFDGRFGNIQDLKSLLKTAAKSDIKVILDLTPNPASIEEYSWTNIDFDDHEMLEWLLFVKGHISSATTKDDVGIKDRLFMMLLFSIPGTPIIFYGEEIGLKDYKVSAYPLMRWDNSKHAGFTKSLPWITPDLDSYTPTVTQQTDDPLSTLTYYWNLAQLRHEEPSLQFGDFHILANTTDFIAYIRQQELTGILVVLNFGDEISVDFTGVYLPEFAVLLAKSRGVTPCQVINLHEMKIEANTGYILKYFISE